MTTTVFIVPATTGLADQCRIVSREGKVFSARDDYRKAPSAWKEIGLMNSSGQLVNLDADNLDVIDELKSREPLRAGVQFQVEDAQAYA